MLFGRLDQAELILNYQFEGKQFFVDGSDGNQIDCMFFPCTNKQNIITNNVIEPEIPEYAYKPTVIMSNPNAYYY